MKSKLLYILLILFTFSVTGQISPIQVTKSSIEKDSKKDTQLMFTADDGNGGFVTARLFYGGIIKSPKGYYIEHYDSNLNVVQEYNFC